MADERCVGTMFVLAFMTSVVSLLCAACLGKIHEVLDPVEDRISHLVSILCYNQFILLAEFFVRVWFPIPEINNML